ncbi:MAG: hypothetical protein WEH44_07310 [Pirellulaceae bacterium]
MSAAGPRVGPRVVKVGGSLFDFDQLAPALRRWLSLEPLRPTVLLAGGGELADAIRRADARHRLGEEAAHWLCVGLLSTTARLLTKILPETELIGELSGLQQRLSEPPRAAIVFDPQPFLVATEPSLPGQVLPRTWQATSDSIAARLAEVLAADLVLLKSVAHPAEATLAALSESGYLDAGFAAAAAQIPVVQLVNLRSLGSPDATREFRLPWA